MVLSQLQHHPSSNDLLDTYQRIVVKRTNWTTPSKLLYHVQEIHSIETALFHVTKSLPVIADRRNVSILSLVRFVGCSWFYDHEIPRKECILHLESSGTLKWLPSYHVVYIWSMASLRALFWVPCYSRYTSNLFLALSISAGVTITDTLTTLSSIIAVFSCHPRTECCATISG